MKARNDNLQMFPAVAIDESLPNMKSVQDKIQSHISLLAQLNQQFHKRQEESFFVTFAKVMDRMAEELSLARQKYQSFEYQIKKEEVCCILEDHLSVYKRENLQLNSQLGRIRKEVLGLRESNLELGLTVQALRNKLEQKMMVATRTHIAKSSSLSKRTTARDSSLCRVPILEFKTTSRTLKKTFFQSERSMDEMFEERRRGASLKRTQPLRLPKDRDPARDLLKHQIQSLWSSFTTQYPTDIQSVSSKQKDRILQLFISYPKMKQLVRSVVTASDSPA